MSCKIPRSYQESRRSFAELCELLSGQLGKTNKLTPASHEIAPGFYIDTLTLEPSKAKKRLLLITTGLHGIEGFVGSAMLRLFAEELLAKLDLSNTGLILVHSLNPWGMEHLRRTNENNVDLNRSFISGEFPADFNRDYLSHQWFFAPRRLFHGYAFQKLRFYCDLIRLLLKSGAKALESMTLLGQYGFAEGIYYGGSTRQPSTSFAMKLLEEVLSSDYEKVIHIDIHTGYGSRDQMSIVNSSQERISAQDYKKYFDYPLVLGLNSEDFYDIKGDFIEYVYRLNQSLESPKLLYSTCFEFGTLGSALTDKLRSLRTMLLENSLYHKGAASEILRNQITQDMLELYAPTHEAWLEKAKADFCQAMSGIIRYFEL